MSDQTGSPSADRSELYAEYVAHMGWLGAGADKAGRLDAGFALDMFRRAGLKPGADILEIGFGDGGLLDWAAGQGYRVQGLEIIPELVEKIGARHAVKLGVVETADFPKASFDGVIAVDVFEHIPSADLRRTLAAIAGLLRPGGVCAARFPNGASPFWGQHMFGDATHTTFLTPHKLEQLIGPAPLTMVGAYNPRAANAALKQRLAYFGRDVLETVLGLLYFGHRIPMDPNVIVILRKT